MGALFEGFVLIITEFRKKGGKTFEEWDRIIRNSTNPNGANPNRTIGNSTNGNSNNRTSTNRNTVLIKTVPIETGDPLSRSLVGSAIMVMIEENNCYKTIIT